MSKNFPRARRTFFIWLALALPFLGWGYSARDILTIEEGRLTLRQTSEWGEQSRLIHQGIKIIRIESDIANNPNIRSHNNFKLAIMDDEGNTVPLPDSMRMSARQINREKKQFQQAITQGRHQIIRYPHAIFFWLGYIFLFPSLLYGMESLKK